MELNFSGVEIGVATFLIIGLFHPLVIKAEYYIGVKSWWLFLLLGIVAGVASLLVHNLILSILLGVVAFSSFWSIGEVFEQKKRVEKGWFPANPKKKNYAHYDYYFDVEKSKLYPLKEGCYKEEPSTKLIPSEFFRKNTRNRRNFRNLLNLNRT